MDHWRNILAIASFIAISILLLGHRLNIRGVAYGGLNPEAVRY